MLTAGLVNGHSTGGQQSNVMLNALYYDAGLLYNIKMLNIEGYEV